tara:strand:- start:5519 stop:6358 length:840 start_codon:yes stop_codon:yes gene_type:complete
MKTFFLFTILIAISLKAGQETWGGDFSSLKFVKAGRIFAVEIQSTADCGLKNIISANRLLATIDSTEVESSDSEISDSKGHIYFHKLKWEAVTQEMKNEVVLQKYLAQADIKISENKAIELAKTCRKSPYWLRNSILSRINRVISDVELKDDIQHISQLLLTDLKNKKVKNLPPKFSIKSLEDAINTIKLPKKNNQNLILDSKPVSFRFQHGMLKDGKNTKGPFYREITINKSVWAHQSIGQKKEFLFHEYLGLLNFRDSNYQYSSVLFFDLDEDDYKK